MKKYITSLFQVNANFEHAILSNGESGDKALTLCCAPGFCPTAGPVTVYYVTRNGTPVPYAVANAKDEVFFGAAAFGGSHEDVRKFFPWINKEALYATLDAHAWVIAEKVDA